MGDGSHSRVMSDREGFNSSGFKCSKKERIYGLERWMGARLVCAMLASLTCIAHGTVT
jgi:hypothetical protein